MIKVNKLTKYIFLALLLLVVMTVVGCSTPEGGSSLPWSQPEPWQNQPQMGVPF